MPFAADLDWIDLWLVDILSAVLDAPLDAHSRDQIVHAVQAPISVLFPPGRSDEAVTLFTGNLIATSEGVLVTVPDV
jgi:hypothetical protein